MSGGPLGRGMQTHHFVENRRIVVLVLDGHLEGAHVVQLRFPVVRRPNRQVHFLLSGRFVPVEHLQERTIRPIFVIIPSGGDRRREEPCKKARPAARAHRTPCVVSVQMRQRQSLATRRFPSHSRTRKC